jgi:NADH-quinone oxidoreductase subunit M
VVDAALFFLLGVLYDRYATSQIAAYGGLASKLPSTATLFVLTTLAMIGLPVLSGFVGEFMILSSTFGGVSRGWAVAASLGVILGATYMLWLVQRIFYGPQSELVASRPADDLHFRELALLWPLAVLTLVMGVAPSIWLSAIELGVNSPPLITYNGARMVTITSVPAGGQR